MQCEEPLEIARTAQTVRLMVQKNSILSRATHLGILGVEILVRNVDSVEWVVLLVYGKSASYYCTAVQTATHLTLRQSKVSDELI